MDANPFIDICYRQAQPEDLAVCYGIKTRSIKPYVSAVWGWNEGFQKAFHEGSFKPEATRILYLRAGGEGLEEKDMRLSEEGMKEGGGDGKEAGAGGDGGKARTGAGKAGERVVGYVEVEYREEEIFLSNILIDEAFQGRGLGTRVLRRLIEEASGNGRTEGGSGGVGKKEAADEKGPVADEMGLPAGETGAATGDSTKGVSGKRRPIRLEVFRINTGARRFYERLGFRVIERDRIKYIMVRK